MCDDQAVRPSAWLFALTLVAAPAHARVPEAAAPKVKNGRKMTVLLGARREEAIGLKRAADGWHALLAPVDDGNYQAEDLTPGARARFNLVAARGELVFDAARFRADHAYRVRRRLEGAPSWTVYLVPDRNPARVDFAAEERDDGAEIDAVQKGSL
jgi:hypothetical protein